ncbi:CLUMA_CG002083, isoform A [Clunio marinus]|uniref:CLUMA_CG002083, isoform A n=1 Tax=Clunio marinus TaxID=568069 RepID=A0A1J1HJS0_9DIPT|nr:CLUMA_CG002083, isoform A [Clunio marinus]
MDDIRSKLPTPFQFSPVVLVNPSITESFSPEKGSFTIAKGFKISIMNHDFIDPYASYPYPNNSFLGKYKVDNLVVMIRKLLKNII